MKTCICAVVLCLGLVGAGTCRADTTGSFHRVCNTTGPVTLEVESGSGTIRVTGAPGSAVTIDGYIQQGESWFGGGDLNAVREIEAHPPIEQAGNTIHIGRLRLSWQENISISYVITTPPETRLTAHSGSGRIEVAGLEQDADLETGSGGVRVAELGGNLFAHTGSGHIEFDRIGGEARLSTGSGGIEGNEVVGRLTASSASGHITVHRLDQGGEIRTASGGMDLDQVAGDLTADAASGSIRAGLTGGHSWNLTTASGGIDLSLPERDTVEAHLVTASGGIHINHPTQRQNEFGRHDWEGVIGNGSGAPEAELRAHAASGTIVVN